MADCCTLEPIVVIGTPGGEECDPYLELDHSCDEDGGGECMSSTGSPGSLDEQTVAGCTGGGGGGGSTAPGDPSGGDDSSGGGSTATPFPSATGPAEEGPLAWGACVLAVLGSVYTIDQVASEFRAWYETERRYRIAYDSWSSMLSHPETQLYPGQLYDLELRADLAYDKRNEAVESVRELAGGSILALLGAGAACGIAAIAPTP